MMKNYYVTVLSLILSHRENFNPCSETFMQFYAVPP